MKTLLAITLFTFSGLASAACGYVNGQYVCVNPGYGYGSNMGSGSVSVDGNRQRYQYNQIGNNTNIRYSDGTRTRCTTVGSYTRCRTN